VRIGGSRSPYVIVMPPPNVTAVLHMGHGLNNTVQDVIIRWRRMCGDEALWLPGTDHAGIATQNVVEKMLAKEGKTRHDVGRAAFVHRTEQFVAETGGVILQQLKAIGASADWTRTAYTLPDVALRRGGRASRRRREALPHRLPRHVGACRRFRWQYRGGNDPTGDDAGRRGRRREPGGRTVLGPRWANGAPAARQHRDPDRRR
jgi:valyl-tRNA synthetase